MYIRTHLGLSWIAHYFSAPAVCGKSCYGRIYDGSRPCSPSCVHFPSVGGVGGLGELEARAVCPTGGARRYVLREVPVTPVRCPWFRRVFGHRYCCGLAQQANIRTGTMVVDPCNEEYAYLSLTVRLQQFGVGPPNTGSRVCSVSPW